MARIECAISGLHFKCSSIDNIYIPHTAGYFHPIFACTEKDLNTLFSQHCAGKLTCKDSYLLFLAFLHASKKVIWDSPASLNPNDESTQAFIENNISQLVSNLRKSFIISHPAFKQPYFRVSKDTSELEQLPNWIKAWGRNIEAFSTGILENREIEELKKIENFLGKTIISGTNPKDYGPLLARWASKTAEFPLHKDEIYKKVIRTCYSSKMMFGTSLDLIKEVKDYCECNIAAGSIHFHALIETLKVGIFKHTDYLGGSSLALGYTLLKGDGSKTFLITEETELENKKDIENKLQALIEKAPEVKPVRANFATEAEYTKNALAYRAARIRK